MIPGVFLEGTRVTVTAALNIIMKHSIILLHIPLGGLPWCRLWHHMWDIGILDWGEIRGQTCIGPELKKGQLSNQSPACMRLKEYVTITKYQPT